MRFSIADARVTRDNLIMSPSKIILPPSILKTLIAPAPPEIVVAPESDSERRPTTPHLSFSQLSMYLRCSMQYWFRYGLGLKERPKVSLSIGKGGHAALEYNAKTKIRTGTDAPVEAVLQKASDMMDHYLSELPPSEIEADVAPGETKDKYIAATKIYRVRDAPTVRPIGAEVEFNLDVNEYLPEPLDEPIRIVNGKIDLLYDDFGTMVSHREAVAVGVEDYKYVTKKKAQAAVDLSPQLTLYAGVVKKLTGKWPTKVGERLMHQGTLKDGPDSIVMTRDPAMMGAEQMERRMARLVHQFSKAEQAIRAGIFMPTDDPISCSWCGYRERCQSSLVDDFEAAKIRAATS